MGGGLKFSLSIPHVTERHYRNLSHCVCLSEKIHTYFGEGGGRDTGNDTIFGGWNHMIGLVYYQEKSSTSKKKTQKVLG